MCFLQLSSPPLPLYVSCFRHLGFLHCVRLLPGHLPSDVIFLGPLVPAPVVISLPSLPIVTYFYAHAPLPPSSIERKARAESQKQVDLKVPSIQSLHQLLCSPDKLQGPSSSVSLKQVIRLLLPVFLPRTHSQQAFQNVHSKEEAPAQPTKFYRKVESPSSNGGEEEWAGERTNLLCPSLLF